MTEIAAFALQGEQGYVTAWTLMHTSTGLLWNGCWHAAFDDDGARLNLFLLVVVAIVFELVENNLAIVGPMWRRLNRDMTHYHTDTLPNSQTDVLVAVLGHGLSELFFATLSRVEASVATFVVAGILVGTFLVYFVTRGYEQWASAPSQEPEADDRVLVVAAER